MVAGDDVADSKDGAGEQHVFNTVPVFSFLAPGKIPAFAPCGPGRAGFVSRDVAQDICISVALLVLVCDADKCAWVCTLCSVAVQGMRLA